MKTMMKTVVGFRRDERGQDLIEYALLTALLAVASIAMLREISSATNGIFSTVMAAVGAV